MKQRLLAIVFVALAVLYCQSGGLVLAAICPHLRARHETCHGMVRELAPPAPKRTEIDPQVALLGES